MEFVFNQKLSELDKTIASLKEALERTKQEKKEIVSQQRLVEKALDTFKTTVKKVSWSGEALEYLKQQVWALIPGNRVQEDKVEELTNRPAKENKSNDFFSWQPTSNEAISNYFNVSKGQTQATYIGSNSKLLLEALENKLTQWLPGVSTSLRKAQRLPYTYELKIRNLDDNTIGWLTAIDFSKPIASQLKQDLSECPQEYLTGQAFELCCLLSEHKRQTESIKPIAEFLNSSLPKYAIVTSKNNRCYQILEKGATKDFYKVWDLETGKTDLLRAKNLRQIELPSKYKFWSNKVIEEDPVEEVRSQKSEVRNKQDLNLLTSSEANKFTSDFRLQTSDFECMAVYYRWRLSNCQTKKELEELRAESSHNFDIFRWAYTYLPEEEKTRIDEICTEDKKLESAPQLDGLKVGSRIEIVSDRHDGKYIGKQGIVGNADSPDGCPVVFDDGENKFFFRSEIKLVRSSTKELLAS
ncbi:MAG: hypothetical protein QNJ54_30295 [Prochloraceae cyanobacterium]|nr:hypothetical protein [Prochloraceae cyanobacterium]